MVVNLLKKFQLKDEVFILGVFLRQILLFDNNFEGFLSVFANFLWIDTDLLKLIKSDRNSILRKMEAKS